MTRSWENKMEGNTRPEKDRLKELGFRPEIGLKFLDER